MAGLLANLKKKVWHKMKSIKKVVVALTLLVSFSSLLAQFEYNQFSNMSAVGSYPRSDRSEVRNISRIMLRVQESVLNFPLGVKRVAVYRVRADRDAISIGMVRFVKSKLEQVLLNNEAVELVVVPEFNLARVKITDTSFSYINSARNFSELRELGERYKIDAFIEGNCTRSAYGDVLLSLKMVGNKTGEILWSKAFIEGPNSDRDIEVPKQYALDLNVGFFTVNEYKRDGISIFESEYGGSANNSVRMIDYRIGLTRKQNSNFSFAKVMMTLSAGLSIVNCQLSLEEDIDGFAAMSSAFLGYAGGGVMSKYYKKESKLKSLQENYWFKPFLKGEFSVPINYSGSFLTVLLGATSDVTEDIEVGGSVGVIPFGRKLEKNASSYIEFGMMKYEINISYNF